MSLIDDSLSDEPAQMVPWALLDGLASLIPAEEISFAELDVVHRRREMQQCVRDLSEHFVDDPEPTGDRAPTPFWQFQEDFWRSAPLTQAGNVRSWSDLYSRVELGKQPLFGELFGPAGAKFFMRLGFPAPAGHARNVIFFRLSGVDFTDRERQILTLLRPHLYEIYNDAARRRQDIPRLTRREWEVLRLVAAGHSNADIASILFTSVSTVRKHLEHIFDRTGVRSRTAAVARMMPEHSASLLGRPYDE